MDTERQHDIQERRERALKLRLRGENYRSIASELGVSVATAHADVSAALQAIPRQTAEQVRQLELGRLEQLEKVVSEVVNAPGRSVPDSTRLRAVEVAVKLSETRRRLLGADAPQQLSVEERRPDDPLAQITDEAGAALVADLERYLSAQESDGDYRGGS